jgi:hypothetical protein
MDIGSIVTLAFNICLIFIIACSVLAMIAGLLKGLFKTTLKTVLKGVLMVVWIFTTPAITRNICNIDLSNLHISPIGVNGTEVQVTTVVETLANLLTSTGFISPMNGVSIYATAIAIVELVLSYIVFLLLMILTQLLISLLTAIVYNSIFRWFLPIETSKEAKRRKRLQTKAFRGSRKGTEIVKGLTDDKNRVSTEKKKKYPILRLGGGALGAVQELIFSAALLAPISALGRTAVKNADNITKTMTSLGTTDTLSTFQTFVSAYDNSAFSKLYTSKHFDSALMNQVSKTNMNGTEVSLDSLISSTFDVVQPVISNQVIESQGGQITLNLSVLLSANVMDAVLASVLNNSTIMALIPPLIDMGISIASSSSNIPLDQLDFSDIDWSNDITAVRSVYEKVYKYILSSVIVNNNFSSSDFKMATSTYTDEDIEALVTVMNKFGSMDFVKKNLGIILSGFGRSLASKGYTLLPEETSQYDDIDWSKDLGSIVKNLLKLLKVLGLDISSSLAGTATDSLLSAMKDDTKREAIQQIVTGEDGLLSLGILSKLKVGSLVKSLVKTNPTAFGGLAPYLSDTKVQTVLDNLDSETSNNLKAEVNTAFSILDILRDPTRPIVWTDNMDWSIIKTLTEPICTEIQDILNVSLKSSLFKSIYPVLMKAFLAQAAASTDSSTDSLLFGLNAYSFNYDDSNFTSDMSKLIVLLPKMRKMYDLVKADSTKEEKILGLDPEAIGSLLSIIANSQLFNPTGESAETLAQTKNLNLKTVIQNLFSRDTLSKYATIIPDDSVLESLVWGDESTGEIGNLVNLLKSLQKNAKFFGEVASGDVSLTTLKSISDSDALVDMFKDVYDSSFISRNVLSKAVDKVHEFLANSGITLDIEDFRTFICDTKNKAKIKEDLDTFKTLIPLINKLNFEEIKNDMKHYLRVADTDDLNAFATAFLSSNFYTDVKQKGTSGDVLSKIGYALFKKADIFTELGLPDYGSNVFNPAFYGEDLSWSSTTKTVELTGKKSRAEDAESVTVSCKVTTVGEIANMMKLLKFGQENVFLSQLKNKDFSSFHLRAFVHDEANAAILEDDYIRGLCATYIPSFFDFFAKEGIAIPDSISSMFKSIDWGMIYGNSTVLTAEQIKSEVDILADIAKMISSKDESGEMLMTRLAAHPSVLLSLSSEETNKITTVLSELGSSKLFTSVKKGSSLSPVSGFFYQFLSSKQQFRTAITLGNGEDAADNSTLMSLLGNMDQNSLWVEEFQSYSQDLLDISGIGLTSQAIKDMNPYAAVFIADGRPELFKGIMKRINASPLLHRAAIAVFRKVIGPKFESLLMESNAATIYPINYYVHLGTTDEDITYWEHDLDDCFDMVYDKTTDEEGHEKYTYEDYFSTKAKFDDIKSLPTRLFYYMGDMYLFRQQIPYIFSSLMKTTDPTVIEGLFHDPISLPYGDEKIPARLKEIFFANYKDLGKTAEGGLEKSKAFQSLECLDNVLFTLEGRMTNVKNVTSMAGLTAALGSSSFFHDLIAATLFYTTDPATQLKVVAEDQDGNVLRSDFASELVAGLLHMIVTIPELQPVFEAAHTAHVQYPAYFPYDCPYSGTDFYSLSADGSETTYALLTPEFGQELDAYLQTAANP